MIPEFCSNRVFYSAKLPEACPIAYRSITKILDKYGVPHEALKATKDIWVRDFMPIQECLGFLLRYNYMPDYLRTEARYRDLISDPVEVCEANGIKACPNISGIRMDGGNVVHGGMKVIMTSKVFEENPKMTVNRLSRLLEDHFSAELIILPWDTNEIYGHADGIVRFVDDETVIMTNYHQFDPKMAARFRNILKAHFKVVHELNYNVEHLSENSWAYINWLQTDRVLIIPAFGIPEDEQALHQIKRWMPQYRDCIEMADASDLVREGGCLNCATWTIDTHQLQSLP